jgi:hypothetical protein
MFNCNTKVRKVSGITPDEEKSILIFLRGMVYAQCAIAPKEWFSVRTLLGYDWSEIPLMALFDKYSKKGNNDREAMKLAGIDAGHLLKKVLADEPSRKFEMKNKDLINQYKWIK